MTDPGPNRALTGVSPNELRLPLLVDALVLIELGLVLVRNIVVAYHPIAWLVGLLIILYGAVLVTKPVNGNTIKLVMLGAIAMIMAIAVPHRTHEPILVASFAALGGLLSLYFVIGARACAALGALYVGYVLYYMSDYPAPIGSSEGYAFAEALGLTTVLLIAGTLLQNVLRQANEHRELAERRAEEIERVLMNMRMAAGAGNLGVYSYSSTSDNWTVNSSFRALFDLPEQAYPVVTVGDVMQRIAPEEIPFAKKRLANLSDQEPGTYQLQMPNGEQRLVTSMSQVVMADDGSWTRHGLVYRHDAPSDAN